MASQIKAKKTTKKKTTKKKTAVKSVVDRAVNGWKVVSETRDDTNTPSSSVTSNTWQAPKAGPEDADLLLYKAYRAKMADYVEKMSNRWAVFQSVGDNLDEMFGELLTIVDASSIELNGFTGRLRVEADEVFSILTVMFAPLEELLPTVPLVCVRAIFGATAHDTDFEVSWPAAAMVDIPERYAATVRFPATAHGARFAALHIVAALSMATTD